MHTSGEIRLDGGEFRLLRDLINERTGLWLGPEWKSVLERRLRERLVVLRLSSFGEYNERLTRSRRGAQEFDEMLDRLTVNETYFFRERYQLHALSREIVPLLRATAASSKTSGERLSIWSAGCSTGEETYSIAMELLDAGLPPGCEVRIFGSDISRRCVAAARRGVYGAASFRATRPEALRRWFRVRPDGSHVVDAVRALCRFGQLNLLDATRAAMVGQMDIIFCRNVLIYFDDDSRRRVLDMFYDRLHPGGILLLGHSESLINVSTAFEFVHLSDDLVYRKPQGCTASAGHASRAR